MAVETELKLRIAPEHFNRLKRHSLLKQLSLGRATTKKFYSVYFDTPTLELHQRAIALRLRHVGKDWLQTMKGGGAVQAGLHQRNEWETRVATDGLDLEALEAIGGYPLPAALREKLKPIFVTDMSRTTRRVMFGGAEIEISLDSGEIRAGEKHCPISELELELKSGEPLQLFKLALVLMDSVPLEIELISKAEYGYQLQQPAYISVCKASSVSLAKDLELTSALRTLISASLVQLQANISGILRNPDVEFLHQARVALRRLRVALSMAEKFRADAALSKLRHEASELYFVLGSLREWDVFMSQIAVHIDKCNNKQAVQRLLRACKILCEQHRITLENRLNAQDYHRFVLKLGEFLQGEYWFEPIAKVLSLREFATQNLDNRRLQVSKRGENLIMADSVELHKMRIACKKLRYSAETFSSLFEFNKPRHYLSALTALQDCLGALNDIAVARRLLSELEKFEKLPVTAEICDSLDKEFIDHKATLIKTWKIFRSRQVFWHS
jgi:inorganic triphosphatase YgiF